MKERDMRIRQVMWQRALMMCLILTVGISTSSCAGISGLIGDRWKEEVLLHDGRKIMVDRMVKRGGRHEVGQKPSFTEQWLSFPIPGSNQTITWEDHASQDLGQANFLPMAVDISGGTPYLVVYPMGCLSYNKWGRPNPPYVIFQYQGNEWKRIPLQELPSEINTPNMIFSMPDVVVEKFDKLVITADMIKGVIAGYPQPEFKTIQREPVKPGSEGSTNCEERVLYKGHWILPNDPIAKKFIDKQMK
ncbi:conserved exported hypothetical protein [Candidatus Nitrospira nitrosa]|uniref:Lipoprotein n=1 Tax=Candidatus Nitrospira nitrosa TaxID=1742972 RepID=A0A0S4L3J2_9BACT|nr:hypothetical protein [Candidatus Nitrospira nitrosa]CUS32167.1 conserved exported hypothetical protein [Candidatus Nitrospira nitrosa]